MASHPAVAVLLDLDGTLVDFAPTPEQAVVDDKACEAVRDLVATGARVMVVSGRPRSAVDPVVAKLGAGVTYYAEHGAWHHDGCAWSGPEAASQDLDALVAAIAATSSLLRVERKSLSVCVHWRSVEPAARPPLIAATELAFEEWLETHSGFELLPGVESLEVRRRDFNKGVAVHHTRRQLDGARIIAIGDDLTDEDMFAELGDNDLGIAVGHHTRPSQARAALAGPTEVHAFLRWLASVRIGATTTSPQLLPLVEMRPSRAHSLVVISNRTPTKIVGRKREVGGLVSALEPALRAQGGIWVGWSGHEREGKPALVIDALGEPNLATFDLTRTLRERFYAGFCNQVLWPLFHSASMRITYSDDEWAAYVAANDAYAGHASELSRPDGTIWVHDYHLLLAARSLRRRGHRGPIGLFLHIPFPPLELLETMPWHKELVAAMQEFDLVGFHTERWAANFQAAVTAVGTGPSPRVGVFPIPIDSSPFVARTQEASDVAGLRAALGSRRLLLGVDRLDYSKGIPERLAGFQRMLERYPEWRGHVSFVQVSVPSRAEIPEYSELRHRVEKMVGTINGQFGEADWVPVRYLYRSYDQSVLAQLYRLADVGLVTPLRDGMNLVAKEFLASQEDARPGVLVLSQFAGAAAELEDAVLTNPFHPDGLAADIDRALRMPLPERVARHGRMIQTIQRSSPQQWSSEFLKELAGAARTRLHTRWTSSGPAMPRSTELS